MFSKFVQKTDIYEKNKSIWKKIMATYNLILVPFSFLSFVGMAYSMCYLPNGVFGLGHFQEPTGWYRTVGYYFYLSKYVEFADTYFLILCQKPVTWLQLIHHIGAPLDMGVWYHNEVEGLWIFPFFNGFIHTIMYTYYACCIMKVPFPCKQLITAMQLLQFFSGLTLVIGYLYVDGYMSDPVKAFAWYFNYTYVGTLVVLFGNFYYRNYLNKSKSKKQQSKTD